MQFDRIIASLAIFLTVTSIVVSISEDGWDYKNASENRTTIR